MLFLLIYVLTLGIVWKQDNDSLRKDTVRIGVISPSEELAPKYQFIANLAQNEINNYCNETGINLQFEYIVSNAYSNPETALNLTKYYREQGINLILGYGWNSQLESSLEYINKEGITVISPASTSPLFSKEDYCFRLCPDDSRMTEAVAKIIVQSNITTVVIIQRGDEWGKEISRKFETASKNERIEIAGRSIYSIDESNYSQTLDELNYNYLNALEKYRNDNVGIFYIGLGEASDILLDASDYPELMKARWFGTDSTTLDPQILENAGSAVSQIKLIGPENSHIYNEEFVRIDKIFSSKFDLPLDFYTANIYDGCWILALSAVEERETGEEISKVLPRIARNHYGITGPCELNENGDRSWVRYFFYGYFGWGDAAYCHRVGHYTYLETYGQRGTSFSANPHEGIILHPPYIWRKDYESKMLPLVLRDDSDLA
ncbi:ABC transporter substrate-binding protein [Candidatus Bathyarchaeota archaeon]|nr:ABC transporter substrate-binding protein [Candidatus Bathyarchaeota archaeon]